MFPYSHLINMQISIPQDIEKHSCSLQANMNFQVWFLQRNTLPVPPPSQSSLTNLLLHLIIYPVDICCSFLCQFDWLLNFIIAACIYLRTKVWFFNGHHILYWRYMCLKNFLVMTSSSSVMYWMLKNQILSHMFTLCIDFIYGWITKDLWELS